MVTELNSGDDFQKVLSSQSDKAAVLFYGDFSSASKESLEDVKILSAESASENLSFFSLDVAKVKNIHKEYKVASVPAMVVFKKGKPVEWILGKQNREFYKKSLLNGPRQFTSKDETGDKPRFPSVVVYSTPTCTYCTKIKNHLKSKGVPYRDIDVAKSQKDADDLVKRTGQMGVPQTFIGGTHVMGFDQNKIDRLLGLA